MVSLHNCWSCGATLLTGEPRPDTCFFWCSNEHRDEYEAKELARQAAAAAAAIKADKAEERALKTAEVVKRVKPEQKPKKRGRPKGSKKRRRKNSGQPKQTANRRIRQISDAANIPGLKPGKRGSYTCGICGEKGHNARRCKKD